MLPEVAQNRGRKQEARIPRPGDECHPLGGFHPPDVAPDAEELRDDHGKTQPDQGKSGQGKKRPGLEHAQVARSGDQAAQGNDAHGTELRTDPVPQETAQGHGGGKCQEPGPDQEFRGPADLLQVQPAPVHDSPFPAHYDKGDQAKQEQGAEELQAECLLFHRGRRDMQVQPAEPVMHQEDQRDTPQHMQGRVADGPDQEAAQARQHPAQAEKSMGRRHELLPVLLFDLRDQGIHGDIREPVAGPEKKQRAHKGVVARGHQREKGENAAADNPVPGSPSHPEPVDDPGRHGKDGEDPQGEEKNSKAQLRLVDAQGLLHRRDVNGPRPEPHVQAGEHPGRGKIARMGEDKPQGFHGRRLLKAAR